MSDHLVHWKDQPPDEGGGSVTRRRVRGEGAELVRVEIPTGTEAAEHSHGHERFVEVLIGRGTVTDAGARRIPERF